MKNFVPILCCVLLGITTVKANPPQQPVAEINQAPTLGIIADAGLCPSREQQTIMLRGISAGAESWQRTGISVVADNNSLFDYLEVHQLANGNGYLKFKAAAGRYGTANVSVTVKDDGGTEAGGVDHFSRNFRITIYAPPVVKVSANVFTEGTKTESKTTAAGNRLQLLATASSTRTEFYWTPGDDLNNADIADPVYTPVTPATKTYRVTATNEYGCKTVDSVKVTPSEISRTLTLSASPNPAGHKTMISFMVRGKDQPVSLNAYGSGGARVANIYNGKVKGGEAYNVPFDGSAYAPGIYYLRLITATESKSVKLVIAH